jgi:mannose-6-phosphate isomerase-like protein (cupin superfamily)
MALILEGGCRVSEMREGAPIVEGTLRMWNQIGRATGAQAISLRILEFELGLSPGFRSDSDDILYVLGCWERGRPVRLSEHSERTLAQVFIDGQSYDIDPDTGVYLRPGETPAINNPGPDSIIIVSCRCPEPQAEQEFSTPLTTPSTGSAPPERPPLVRLADRPAQPTADRWYRVLVDDEVGSTQATQFVGSIPPGRAPDHFHQYEEVLFILRGEGRMWAGETNTPIGPGSCIYLPKGQVHCVENTGKDELRLLGVFYPAGSPSVRYEV